MIKLNTGILFTFNKPLAKVACNFPCKILLVLLLLSSTNLFSQPYFIEDLVNVKGQLVNEATGEGVPYAHIINQRIHGGTISDKDGFFSLQADPSDTLFVKSIGYVNYYIRVSDYIKTDDEQPVFKLAPIRYLIEEVDVVRKAPEVNMQGIPKGKKVDTPVELRSDAFSSNPHWSAAIFKPLSFLQYNFSKKEKSKRTALATIKTQKEWEYFSLVYNKDIIERITGLVDEELDDFMVYCNVYHGLHYSASRYEVEERITEIFEVYRKFYLANSE